MQRAARENNLACVSEIMDAQDIDLLVELCRYFTNWRAQYAEF